MDSLQILVIIMGLVGQILIAQKNAAGYAFWIVGNIALMFVYNDLRQYGLMGLQVVNTVIQAYAVSRWVKDRRTLATKSAGAAPLDLMASKTAHAT